MKRIICLTALLVLVGCASTGPTESPKPSTDETHTCESGFHWENQGAGGRCVANP